MIVHHNGKLVRREDARIDPFDRGFVFGDGIYEGLRAVAHADSTRIVGINRHVERMRRGLEVAGIAWDPARLREMSLELLRINGLRDAFIYWQVTRGTPGPGDPVRSRVPSKAMRPTVFGYCSTQPPLSVFDGAVPTKSAAVVEDRRWLLGHVKSVSLIGNVLASMEADGHGAEDAIFVRDGVVTEGLATNVIIVDGQGRMATPSLESAPMLAGVTRAILLQAEPRIESRRVDAAELASASEVILTGTTTMVTAVTRLDGRPVGNGSPGPVARMLLNTLLDTIRGGRDDIEEGRGGA